METQDPAQRGFGNCPSTTPQDPDQLWPWTQRLRSPGYPSGGPRARGVARRALHPAVRHVPRWLLIPPRSLHRTGATVGGVPVEPLRHQEIESASLGRANLASTVDISTAEHEVVKPLTVSRFGKRPYTAAG
jgi:hypothetical protein